MTREEAFYGTYKLDRDGKPHLKEGFFHPFGDIWCGIFIFTGAVGCVVFLMMLAMQLQFYRSAALHPNDYDPLTWKNYITVMGFGAAFLLAFPALAIPRWFFCRGTMHLSFALALTALAAAQVVSYFAIFNVSPTLSLTTLGSVLWLVLSGAVLIVLNAAAICMIAAGLTYLINIPIARRRMAKANS
ncbi:MAG: hypothetical protein ACI4GO_02240 [Hominenteromicrobium sp.]